jgi:hypothetical protein
LAIFWMSGMRNCRVCGDDLVRVPRGFSDRFVYSAVFECRKCGARETLDQWFLFMFGRTSRCPLCGGFHVKKLGEVDDIDPMYKNPISYFQKWFGGSIHWCPACRLQFCDIRKRLNKLTQKRRT